MGLKMPKGVLFDLDGTLLDSAPDFIVSLDNLLERYNQPKLDPEIIRSHAVSYTHLTLPTILRV